MEELNPTSPGVATTGSEGGSSSPTSPAEYVINGNAEATDDGDAEKKARQKVMFGKRKRNKEEMLCQVCGDKAQGVNFDAITCESCKAFFRRNALKEKKGKCLFDGNCSVNVTTRKFCSFCRLRKCFTIGMNKELILGDAERKRRMEKVMHNREKKMKLEQQLSALAQTQTTIQLAAQMVNAAQVTGAATGVTLNGAATGVTLNGAATGVTLTGAPAGVTLNGAATCCTQEIQYYQGQVTPITLTIPSSSPISLPETITVPPIVKTEVVTTELPIPIPQPLPTQPTPIIVTPASLAPSPQPAVTLASPAMLTATPPATPSLPSTPGPAEACLLGPGGEQITPISPELDLGDTRKLTAWEDATLKDIKEMFNISFCVDVEPHIHVKVKDPKLNHLINQSGITVLRIIKFAKQLKEFVRLPQEHQIGILKGAVLDILLLRSVAHYDLERDAWVTPKGEISTQILKSATGFVELYNAYVEYCKSLRLIIGNDNMIIAIMLVIGLFSPEGQHVLARQVISGFQDQYLTLLKHYLEANYSYTQTAEMFPKLLCKIKEIKDFADKYGKVVMDVNPSEIEPLMLEILDLK